MCQITVIGDWRQTSAGIQAININQSINYISPTVQQHKNEYQQKIKHSDGLSEKQIAHLSWSPK